MSPANTKLKDINKQDIRTSLWSDIFLLNEQLTSEEKMIKEAANAYAQDRLMTRVLDVGSLPSGKDIKEQLEKWKDSPFDPTYDAGQTMVQSLMRYNQLFSIKINIKIAGDFTLRAGDMIYCEFPELTTDPNTPVNKGSGGLYMISSLCHNLTPRKTETSLTLVRDSFGRKPFKSD